MLCTVIYIILYTFRKLNIKVKNIPYEFIKQTKTVIEIMYI